MPRQLASGSRMLGLALVMLCLGCTSAVQRTERRASDEMEAGYKAARRGYWQEALQRFESANAMHPQSSRVLSNLALALEAVGRYDEARATYERAMNIDPSDRNVKRNYSRFKEMYASLIAAPEEDDEDEAAPGEGERPDEPEDEQPEEAGRGGAQSSEQRSLRQLTEAGRGGGS